MALREINLVPESVVVRRRMRRHLLLWLVALLLVVGPTWGVYLYSSRVVLPLTARHAKRSDIEARLRARIADIEQVQEDLTGLSFVRDLNRRRSYDDVLWRIADALNDGTRLVDLRLVRLAGGGSELALVGVAKNNTDLGEVLNRLYAEPIFQDVTLGPTSRQAIPSVPGVASEGLVRFEIVARVADMSVQGREGRP